jgi:hypothetical protein
MRLAGVMATFLVLAVGPATAWAGTARVAEKPVDPEECPANVECSYAVLEFTGAPGEANRVEVSAGGPERTYVIRDDGADVQPGPGCTPQGRRAVRCEIPAGVQFHEVDLRGGDMNDELTLSVPILGSMMGEAGDDVIVGSETADRIAGGPGADRMSGRGERDFFEEDATRAAVDNDTVDGGPGFDEIDYAERRRPIRVKLADPSAPAGESGENDRLTSVESVRGGQADDVLRAGAERVLFYGGPGDDRLHGALGDDSLWAGEGNDRLYGGGGVDILEGEDGSDGLVGGCGRDYLRGGSGRDRLYADDGYRDKVGGGSGTDFARFDQLDLVRHVESRQRRRIDACAL